MKNDGEELGSSGGGRKIKRKKSRKGSGSKGSSGPAAKRIRADPNEDKISQLPEHIIHQILAGLRNPKDLARASILSKRWREFCSSFPALNLDQRVVTKKEEEKKGRSPKKPHLKAAEESQVFRDIVDRALLNCQERELPIDKLVMHMTSHESGLLHSADELLGFVAGNKIKELDLHFPINNKSNAAKAARYFVPQTVLNASSLTSLRLYGCKLGDCREINLPNLRRLCLGKLYVTDYDMKVLIKSCPLIEDLRVIYCTGLTKLRVSVLPKLYKLEAHYCRELIHVQVAAPTLHTFCYHRKKAALQKRPCNIDLSTCSGLKALKLEEPYLKDDAFENMLDKFPLLEVLELTDCHSFKRIMLTKAAMKRLAVRGCVNLEDVSVLAPNLRSFEFKGNAKSSLSLEPQSLKEAKLVFKTKKEGKNLSCATAAELSLKLREILGRFTQNNGMKLVIQANKNVIIHEDLTEIILPPLADVEIEVVKASRGFEDILDSVLHTWHPETISIVSSTDSPLLKSMVGIMKRSHVQPSCCAYNAKNNKCWRHFLKGAKIEELEVAEDAQQSSWVSDVKSSPTTLKTTTLFRLSWLSRRKGAAS